MPLDSTNYPPRDDEPERRDGNWWDVGKLRDEYSIVERCLDQIERRLGIRLTACERVDVGEHVRWACADYANMFEDYDDGAP